jgi:hypothetical protein
MHRLIGLILGTMLMFLAFSVPAGAFTRTVLLEDFTNWG